jgi:hypothetical protein
MTVTTKWGLNTGQWVQAAYRRLGVVRAGNSPTDAQYQEGIDALAGMITGWQADGINLFRQEQLAIIAGAFQGQPSNILTIPDAAEGGNLVILGLEEARWVVSPAPNLFERPLGIFTYGDYMSLPNKGSSASSGPSVIMFDRQIGASNLYLFPVPAQSGTINATVARPANISSEVTDPVDLPIEWTENGIYSLADRLMENYGVAAADPATAQRITERAQAFTQRLENFDRPASIMMRPFGRKGRGKIWRG